MIISFLIPKAFFTFILLLFIILSKFRLETFLLAEKTIKVYHYREQRDKRQLDCTYLYTSFGYFQENKFNSN